MFSFARLRINYAHRIIKFILQTFNEADIQNILMYDSESYTEDGVNTINKLILNSKISAPLSIKTNNKNIILEKLQLLINDKVDKFIKTNSPYSNKKELFKIPTDLFIFKINLNFSRKREVKN